MNLIPIFSFIFKIGACYGLLITDDRLLQAIGVILAIGFLLEAVDRLPKESKIIEKELI